MNMITHKFVVNVNFSILVLVAHSITASSSFGKSIVSRTVISSNVIKSNTNNPVDSNSSIYLNGNGASAQLPLNLLNNLSQFTIDFWVNTTENRSSAIFWQRPTLVGLATAGDNSGDFAINTNNGYIGFYEGFSTQNTDQSYVSTQKKVNDNIWHHIALVNDGNSCKLYVDGVLESSLISGKKIITNVVPVTLGAEALDNQIANAYYHQAKFTEVRISKSVRYNNSFIPETYLSVDSNTIGLYHFDGNCINSKNLDASNYHNDLVINNSDNNSLSLAKINSCSPLPFAKAMSFNGNNQSAKMPNNFMNNYKKFTIETWVLTKNISKSSGAIWQNPTIIGIENPGFPDGDFGVFTINGYLGMYSGLSAGPVDDSIKTRAFIADSVWHHIALVADSVFLNLFLDGVKVSQISMGRQINTTQKGFGIMMNNSSSSGFTAHQSGYIDELRFSNNVRYTSNFIPEKNPFVTDSNTLALFHFDSCFANKIYDYSGRQNHGDLQNIICYLPIVTQFTPSIASTNTTVLIKGTGFTGATSITFGGTAVLSYTILNDSAVIAIIGNGASGSVTVTTPSGSGSLTGFIFCIPTISTSNITICPSELPFSWNGLIFTNAGTQSKHFTNATGCDSIATLNLAVTQVPIPTASSVCVGSTLQLTNAISGGVWSSANNRATINETGLITGRNAGTAVITYKKNGVTTTYNIAVNAIPNVPSIGYAVGFTNPQIGAPTGAFCINRTFGVVGNPSGGIFTVGNNTVLTINCSGIVKTIGLGSGSLKYTYTNAQGCSNSRTLFGTVVNCAARSSNAEEQQETRNDFSIYPNPAISFFILNVNWLDGSGKIIISDVYGKEVKTQPLSLGKNNIDISNLPRGIYLITTITTQGKTTKKLVVQ